MGCCGFFAGALIAMANPYPGGLPMFFPCRCGLFVASEPEYIIWVTLAWGAGYSAPYTMSPGWAPRWAGTVDNEFLITQYGSTNKKKITGTSRLGLR